VTIETTDAATRPPRAERPAAAGGAVERGAARGERAARDIRPTRPSAKPNGQWKVDGTTPLNGNEEWKQADGGLNVRERIETLYAHGGFQSIDPTDLHGRFRWWGLYTQRKPGIDGGRTATLEPHELEDEYFMLRVRIDGGQLTTEQLRVIGGISTEFGRDTADLTDRQNVQLHWIRVEDVPEIWRRLEAVGLGTTEACGDVPRVILGSPVAGIAADELIDPTPQIDEITSRFIGDESLANLPRKFKSAITGHPSQDVVHEINDVAFVAVEHPSLAVGYDLWVGGGLSTAPRLAERLGVFVAPDRVADAWHGVAQIFRDYGYRRLRNKARLKFLLADWGVEKFRRVLETEYLDAPLPDGPAAPTPSTTGDHVGVHRQKDGRFYVGATPIVGRVSGPTLTKLADLVEAHGSTRLRTTPHQKVVILDIPEDRVESLVAGLDELGLQARPSLIRRGTIACTGIEFCKLAIVETKAFATAAVLDLEERLDAFDLPHPIALHVNGCPNSCARIQTADIGLKGQLIMDDSGEQVPGYQVHLGGGLASQDRDEAGLGRTVRGLKVTADGIADYVERVVTRFLDDRDAAADETFAQWAHRADEEALR
jgi:sulfite reductase (ferredoxin)